MNKTKITYVFLIVIFFFSLSVCKGQKIEGKIQIQSVSVLQRSIKIIILAENTGTTKHEFPIGCSLQKDDGSWYDLPYQMHLIEKNEKKVAEFVADNINLREYTLVRAAIWDRERSDGLLETMYDMDERTIE